MLVAGPIVFFIGSEQLEAAVPKGEPGSSERKQYCRERLRTCLAPLDAACGIQSDPTAENFTEVQLCRSSETEACVEAFGDESKCLTRALVSGASWELERYDSADKALSAPEENKQPLRKSLRFEANTSNSVAARDSQARDRAESTVSLKPDQKLLLTNGNHVERKADGTVNVIEMNGRTAHRFPGGTIVRDKAGTVSIISGGKRVEAGVFKAIESSANQRDRGKVRDHR
jgi:hypothetical protein